MPRRRFLLPSVFAAVWVGGLALQAIAVSAFGVSSSPCSLISKAQIKKDLGLAHLDEKTVIGPHYPQEQDGQVASNCTIFAWSGSKPTTKKQTQQKLANGTFALAYIRTWITDSGPEAHKWENTGFGKTLSANIGACHSVMTALHGHTFTLPRDGAQNSAGYQSIKGAALNLCGVWDRYDSHRIIVLTLGQSKHKPVVKHLKEMAKTAVSAFW